MKPLGRSQKIAIYAMAIPFTIATVALFTGKAEFSEWAIFVGATLSAKLATVLGFGALVKKI